MGSLVFYYKLHTEKKVVHTSVFFACKRRIKYSIYFLNKNKSLPLTRIKMHIYVAEKAKKYSYVRK